jgi:hypothetical protein
LEPNTHPVKKQTMISKQKGQPKVYFRLIDSSVFKRLPDVHRAAYMYLVVESLP